METTDRSARDRLSLLAELQRDATAYGFFVAVRALECAHPTLPRIGTSRRLRDDPMRFGQEPSMGFALSSLSRVRGDGAVPRLLVNFMGLFGPNGPLPFHLTEYARDRDRNVGDRTLVDFIDMFHHRILSLFYRAWAEAQPTVSLDRPAQDGFGRRVASLTGYGMTTLRERDAVPDFDKIAHAGLLSRGVRNAEGLAEILRNVYQVGMHVRSWQPHWMRLPADSLTRLGAINETAQLGVTTVLGARVWDCQSRFRIVIGPMTLAEYETFLPGGQRIQQLRDWVLNYKGHELSCDTQLVLKAAEVPPIRLGRSGRLGWTSWLGRRRTAADADDLVLQAA